MGSIMVDLIENTWETLRKTAFKENKNVEKELGTQLLNYDKLYRNTTLPFSDRELNIRWVKLPTFIFENKPQYYAVFLNSINYWRKGEIKHIKKQSLESIDRDNVDSYTIFQVGKFHGSFDFNENMRYYRTFIFNTKEFTEKNAQTMFGFIGNLIKKRAVNMLNDGLIFGILKQDTDRLLQCSDFLLSIYSYNIIRNIRSTYNTSSKIIRKEGKHD